MRWLVTAVLAFVNAFGSGLSAAQQPRAERDSDILSKADAIRLFSLTKQQWLDNIKAAVASKAATAVPGDPRMPKMAMSTSPHEFLIVGVDYSKGDGKPAFIQVVVGYRPTRRPPMTAAMLSGVIAEAQRQMAPEFHVFGNVEDIEGGVGVFFTILDQRSGPRAPA